MAVHVKGFHSPAELIGSFEQGYVMPVLLATKGDCKSSQPSSNDGDVHASTS
jgi:hypothetical protein